jgi:hypothetical protein
LPRNLLLLLFVVAAAVCLASQIAVVRAVLSGRAPGLSRRPAGRWAEMAWVVIPAIGLVAVLIATWLRIAPDQAASPLSVLS